MWGVLSKVQLKGKNAGKIDNKMTFVMIKAF